MKSQGQIRRVTSRMGVRYDGPFTGCLSRVRNARGEGLVAVPQPLLTCRVQRNIETHRWVATVDCSLDSDWEVARSP
jgi:hypothetical protein